jgi:hypothetical protein
MGVKVEMTEKISAWLAWALCAVVIAGALVSFVLAWNDPKLRVDFLSRANALLSALFPIAFGVVGALILSRLTRNRIGWLLMVIGLALGVGGSLLSLAAGLDASRAGEPTFATFLLTWLNGWSWWLLMGPLLLILLTFPTGQLLSPRWRWVVGLIALLFVIFIALVTLSPEWQDPNTGAVLPNPLGVNLLPADFTFETIQVPWVIALTTTVALCVLSVLVRYRRSGIIEREQLKWFLFACALLIAIFSVIGILFTSVDPPPWTGVLFNIVLAFIPVSIGIAILRYRLFDIDVIIRRTLTYGLVTALLAFVFFGSVILLQQLFAGLTGSGQNELVTVLSTLAIAALFVPLRNRVQDTIDRRFNRKKYDAQQVLNDFANTVRDETDLERLTARLVEVVDETMQPSSVSMWLKREERGK